MNVTGISSLLAFPQGAALVVAHKSHCVKPHPACRGGEPSPQTTNDPARLVRVGSNGKAGERLFSRPTFFTTRTSRVGSTVRPPRQPLAYSNEDAALGWANGWAFGRQTWCEDISSRRLCLQIRIH